SGDRDGGRPLARRGGPGARRRRGGLPPRALQHHGTAPLRGGAERPRPAAGGGRDDRAPPGGADEPALDAVPRPRAPGGTHLGGRGGGDLVSGPRRPRGAVGRGAPAHLRVLRRDGGLPPAAVVPPLLG